MPIIDALNLRIARRRRKWTQAELAARLGVSKRQVAEWERPRPEGQPLSIRRKNFDGLINELQLPEEELNGVSPVSKHPRIKSEKKVLLRLRVSPRTRLYYDLVKRSYGPSLEELVEAAPLLFAVLADQSLKWREEQLADARKAGTDLFFKQGALLPLELMKRANEVFEAWEMEEESISSKDVFATSYFNDELGAGISNRFADFLYYLQGVEPDLEATQVEGVFPDLPIFECKMRSICGEPDKPHAARAAFALFEGFVRISDMPFGLWGPDASDKRAEWLAGKAPDPGPGRTYKLGEGYVPYLDIFEPANGSFLEKAINMRKHEPGGNTEP